jgi:hypothetical protein
MTEWRPETLWKVITKKKRIFFCKVSTNSYGVIGYPSPAFLEQHEEHKEERKHEAKISACMVMAHIYIYLYIHIYIIYIDLGMHGDGSCVVWSRASQLRRAWFIAASHAFRRRRAHKISC